MRLIITFVDSDVVGEETRLEVGEGISSSREGKVERAMGFEPTTSCLGSWFQARLFVNTRKATKGLTPSGEKWLIEALHQMARDRFTLVRRRPNPRGTGPYLYQGQGEGLSARPWSQNGHNC